MNKTGTAVQIVSKRTIIEPPKLGLGRFLHENILLSMEELRMGIMKKMIKKAVLHKAEDVIMSTAVKHAYETRSSEVIVKNSSIVHKLRVKTKFLSVARDFTVFDESKNKKYMTNTDLISFGFPVVRLYDLEGNEIGHTSDDIGSYVLNLDGRELDSLTRKKLLKPRWELDFNDWHMKSDLMNNHFKVFDGSGTQIIQIHALLGGQNEYVVEYNDLQHELIALLLMQAIEIFLHKKK